MLYEEFDVMPYTETKSWGTKHLLRKCRNELEPNECRNHKQERKPQEAMADDVNTYEIDFRIDSWMNKIIQK